MHTVTTSIFSRFLFGNCLISVGAARCFFFLHHDAEQAAEKTNTRHPQIFSIYPSISATTERVEGQGSKTGTGLNDHLQQGQSQSLSIN